MKKVIIAVLVVVSITSGLLVGCIGGVTGSGILETEDYDFSDFDQLNISHAFEFDITRSNSYSVSITADDNLMEYIQVTKTGQTLNIGLKTITSLGRVTLKAEVTMPQLRSLELSGATRGSVSGFSSTENLDIEVSGACSLDLIEMSAGDVKFDVSGASKVTGEIAASDADFNVDGASTVQLEGSANDIVIDVSGASRIKLAAFPVNNADVELSGASTGTVNLDGRLDADLSGASRLEYMGEPTMGTINTSGASTIRQK